MDFYDDPPGGDLSEDMKVAIREWYVGWNKQKATAQVDSETEPSEAEQYADWLSSQRSMG